MGAIADPCCLYAAKCALRNFGWTVVRLFWMETVAEAEPLAIEAAAEPLAVTAGMVSSVRRWLARLAGAEVRAEHRPPRSMP